MGQAPEALVVFVFEQAAGGRQGGLPVGDAPVRREAQIVQPGQGGGVPGRQLAQHVRLRVHGAVQVEHHPGGDAHAEVLGEARQHLGQQPGVGVVDAEVKGRLVGAAAQAPPPLRQPVAPALGAGAGDQAGRDRHQFAL